MRHSVWSGQRGVAKLRWGRSRPALGPAGRWVAVGLVIAFCGVLLGMTTRGIINLVASAGADTEILYSARLLNKGQPVTDTCDFRFALYDAKFGGRQIGKPQHRTIQAARGVFTTTLDFGRAARSVRSPYIDVAVRCPAGSGEYVPMVRRPLGDRQAWFDIQGFQQLADSLLGTEPGEGNPESAQEVKTGPPPQVNEKALDTSDTQRASKLETVGLKLRDNVVGHDGAKQAFALSRDVDRSGASVPGQRRLAGSKGLGQMSNRPSREARRLGSLSVTIIPDTPAPDAITQGNEDPVGSTPGIDVRGIQESNASGQEVDLVPSDATSTPEPDVTEATDPVATGEDAIAGVQSESEVPTIPESNASDQTGDLVPSDATSTPEPGDTGPTEPDATGEDATAGVQSEDEVSTVTGDLAPAGYPEDTSSP